MPSNGQCAPVQQPIAGCINYSIDSKCDLCNDGSIPTVERTACVRLTSSNNPNLKPCPANTRKLVYRRNPSDVFGDCVAVDVNCAYSRDDGFCVSCGAGSFSHSDGLCYKIVYFNWVFGLISIFIYFL